MDITSLKSSEFSLNLGLKRVLKATIELKGRCARSLLTHCRRGVIMLQRVGPDAIGDYAKE